MYYARIVIILPSGVKLDIPENEKRVLFKRKKKSCIIKQDTRFPGIIKYAFTYGPFNDEPEALQEGRILFLNIKKGFVRKNIPISLNNEIENNDIVMESNQTAIMTPGGIQHLREQYGLQGQCENETMGLQTYKIDGDPFKVNFVSQRLILTKIHPMPSLDTESTPDRYLSVYSLINASNIINDNRAQFNLLISAIETIVSDNESMDETYCSVTDHVVENLQYVLKAETLTNKIDDRKLKEISGRIKDALCRSKQKGIRAKCRDLIIRCNLTELYNNKTATEFFDNCYTIRSRWTHAGIYNSQDINSHIEYLKRLALDILAAIDT